MVRTLYLCIHRLSIHIIGDTNLSEALAAVVILCPVYGDDVVLAGGV